MQKKQKTPGLETGVYTALNDLIRLQHKARGFSFLPRQPMHSLLSGKHASKLRGRGLNFEELRNYLPGDDIRTMDWKATLRTGKPHIRVYTEERERPAFIIIDQRISMFFGSRLKMKSVTAAEIGAVGAWRVFDQGDRAGAIIFNDETSTQIKPQRSRRNVLRILGEIVRYNHALTPDNNILPNPGMLNRVLEQAERIAPHDCMICIITDMQGADKKTRETATRIARHNDVIVGFVYDPLEQNLPHAGKVSFSEGEKHLEVDTADKKFQKRFTSQFDDQLENGRRVLLQRAVPLVPISAGEDPVKQIQRLLGYARSLRRRN